MPDRRRIAEAAAAVLVLWAVLAVPNQPGVLTAAGLRRFPLELPLLAAKIHGKTATLFVVEDAIAKKVSLDVVGERDGSVFVKAESLKPSAQVVTQGRSLLAHNDRVFAKVEPTKRPEEQP